MKNGLVIITCLLLVLSFLACGQKADQEPAPGAAGQAEEIADTTRMDSAAADDMAAGDSAAGVVEEAREDTTGH